MFQIQKMIGNFEITKICDSGNEIFFNKSDKTMDLVFGREYVFHIMANVNFEPANVFKSIDILYHLSVSAARIKPMKIFQYMEKEIILPGYETLKFKCLIKKIQSNQVEIHILNPLKIIINDNDTDFHAHVSATEDIYLKLFFVLNSVVRGNVQNALNSSAPPAYDSVFQDPLV
uniref:Uncharacterized protein n=1 Tax=Panagrolaimus sp. PS1159 TaxID=55785 RepID=A0AC35EZ06_9BILA